MGLQDTAMHHVSPVGARQQLADVMNSVAFDRDRASSTHQGKALAAVVPIEDVVKRLEALKARKAPAGER